MRKFKLIYNSIAGQSKFKNNIDEVIEKFTSNNCDLSIFRVSKSCNLEAFILESIDEYEGIVIAGGDGTINKVVNIIMNNKLDIPIGILPAGTSNDFAKHLRLSKNYIECTDNIINGEITPIDVGCVNNKYFINICSAGLFTSASQNVDIVLKNRFGKAAYISAGAKQLMNYKPINIKIETESKIIVEKVMLFLVFNGSSAGGMDKLAAGSSIRDGLLDIVIFKASNFMGTMKYLGEVLQGTHLKDKNVIHLKEKWIKIDKIDGRCDEPDIDGEMGPSFPLEIKCIHSGIKLFGKLPTEER